MYNLNKKFDEFIYLLRQNSPEEGVNLTQIKGVATFKSTVTQKRSATVDQPVIMIVAQGNKRLYFQENRCDIGAKNVLIRFCPMIVEAEIVEASVDEPLLLAGIAIDLRRLASVLARVEEIDRDFLRCSSKEPSCFFSIPLTDNLLDPFIRLFRLLDSERDSAMLADSIIDEIYYRLLCDEMGGELRVLLKKNGEIQRIAKAIEYIHQNLDKQILIEDLANIVHMRHTSFFTNFKKVMHMTPLKYIKSLRLIEAQKLIMEGKSVSEACYLVGYNSTAQFSREYKRYFGYVPSSTLKQN